MRRRIRLLHVISRLNAGGPARCLKTLADELDKNAFEFMLAYGTPEDSEGDMTDKVVDGSFEHFRIEGLRRRISPGDDAKALRRLVQLTKALRPDIVHTHAAKGGALGRLAAGLAGVPITVHTYHGHVFHGYFPPIVGAAIASIERRLAALTTAIITLTPSQRDEIVKRYRIAPADKVHVIPIGIKTTNEHPPSTRRNTYGFPPGSLMIGSAGRLVKVKGVDVLLRAFKEVSKQTSRACLVVAGDGEERTKMERLAQSLDVSSKVRFLGWLDDMKCFYNSIDLFVQSSFNEGLPLTILEAMTAGVCIVATAAGGVTDVLETEYNALLVPPGDVHALALAIQRCLGDPGLRRHLGNNAKKDAAQFRSEVYVKKTAGLYFRLTEQFCKTRPR